MAYMSQEQKKIIHADLKKIIPKSWKWSLSVSHHSTIVLSIQAADVDLCTEYQRCCNNHYRNEFGQRNERPDYAQLNPYYLENQFDESLEIMELIKMCLYKDHWDESDSQTDYFHCAYYVHMNLGRWDKPFQYLEPMKQAA